jgi:hypothetical protein
VPYGTFTMITIILEWGQTSKMYVNGSLSATSTTVNTSLSSDLWYLGLNGTTFAKDVKGLDLMFWQRTLTTTEMEDLYNSGDGLWYN